MAKQSEQILEEQLIKLLSKQGYQYVAIENEYGLINNLKNQGEKSIQQKVQLHNAIYLCYQQ